MKNMFRFSALLCAMAVLVTSCTKDETLEPQRKPAAIGDQIVFGARAGFENGNPDSRTVYSGETYEITNSDGTKTFERIDWVADDVVEIYSDKALGQTAHYKVTKNSTDENGSDNVDTKDEGTLSSENGLQWGSNEDHTFYAMYPSSTMFDPTSTLAQGVKLSTDLKMVGIVPRAQQSIGWDETLTSDGNYIAKPDMRYAYMAAKKTVAPSASVSLDFVPVVTAVEIELQAQDLVIPITELYVSGTGIAGTFYADLGESWTGTYPTCSIPEASDENPEYDQIIFSIPEAIELQPDKSLKFTVFMRPHANVSDLKIGFSQTGSDTKYKDMSKIQIPAKCKTVIKDVLLPADEKALEIDASRWMEQLEDEMDMARLSLPGAGGAFTSAYSNADYVQQSLDFDGLWKAGIRAFEAATTRVNESPASVDEASSLGGLDIICNGTEIGITLQDVVLNLVQKVSSGTETAMLILTYQPTGGGGADRNGVYYARNLRKFYNTLTGGTLKTPDGKHTVTANDFVLYTPETKLGSVANATDARGKVMIIARPTQHDEEDNYNEEDANGNKIDPWTAIKNTMAGSKILMLDGCGTAKDRWGKRGYKVRGTTALDIVPYGSSFSTSIPCVEYYLMQTGSLLSGFQWADYAANVTRDTSDFTYQTDEGYACYYQDWARVVSLEHLGVSDAYYQVSRFAQADFRWYESLQEKKDDVEKTFTLALQSKPADNVIYINSLCGYLVDKSIEESYTPFPDYSGKAGGTGNIGGLASIMNDHLETIVRDAGMSQETGPTGIVLMDFVTSNSPAIGAIISNNFKF